MTQPFASQSDRRFVRPVFGLSFFLPSMASIALAVLATGCAMSSGPVVQSLRIDAATADRNYPGTDCELSHSGFKRTFKSSTLVDVSVTKEPLSVVCGGPQGIARATLYSRPYVNGSQAANPSTVAYPTWVQVKFGRTLVFEPHVNWPTDFPSPPTSTDPRSSR